MTRRGWALAVAALILVLLYLLVTQGGFLLGGCTEIATGKPC